MLVNLDDFFLSQVSKAPFFLEYEYEKPSATDRVCVCIPTSYFYVQRSVYLTIHGLSRALHMFTPKGRCWQHPPNHLKLFWILPPSQTIGVPKQNLWMMGRFHVWPGSQNPGAGAITGPSGATSGHSSGVLGWKLYFCSVAIVQYIMKTCTLQSQTIPWRYPPFHAEQKTT